MQVLLSIIFVEYKPPSLRTEDNFNNTFCKNVDSGTQLYVALNLSQIYKKMSLWGYYIQCFLEKAYVNEEQTTLSN